MRKLLLSLILLSLPSAACAGAAVAMRSPAATATRAYNLLPLPAYMCWEIARAAEAGDQDNILLCVYPGTSGERLPYVAGGFPFYPTRSVLRWRGAPAQNPRRSIPLGQRI